MNSNANYVSPLDDNVEILFRLDRFLKPDQVTVTLCDGPECLQLPEDIRVFEALYRSEPTMMEAICDNQFSYVIIESAEGVALKLMGIKAYDNWKREMYPEKPVEVIKKEVYSVLDLTISMRQKGISYKSIQWVRRSNTKQIKIDYLESMDVIPILMIIIELGVSYDEDALCVYVNPKANNHG